MKPQTLITLALGLLATSAFAQPKPPLPGMANGKTAPAVKPAVAPVATGKLAPIGDGATVLSADGKLIWTRCHIGQSFEKDQCVGEPKKMDQRDAENEVKRMNLTGGFAGSKDWRLPTIAELQSIVFCEQGMTDSNTTVKLAGGQNHALAESCKGENYLRPTIDPLVFPNANTGWVWSATPDQDRVINVWALNFASGSPAPISRHNNQTSVRAVRAAK